LYDIDACMYNELVNPFLFFQAIFSRQREHGFSAKVKVSVDDKSVVIDELCKCKGFAA